MIKTKRWNDPVSPGDGLRVLVTRYRPRGVRKGEEPWDEWRHWLGPSRELHADYFGKRGRTIAWDEYRDRYEKEMQAERPRAAIAELAARHARGETVTLLCFCADETRCHRSLLARLVAAAAGAARARP
ncbi:MAG TPA: hypothetical protein DCM87_17010 [Planctomycetes bacterium]|nr:hypothetical protein [Planctomycetota bacterium]